MDERLRFTNLRYTSIRFLETWRARQRIPRDITCSYSRVFYRQSISAHVSRAAKKTSESWRQIDRASILRAKRIFARREAWYRFLGSRKRVVRATANRETARFAARDQRHLHTERNRRLSKSFVYILRRPSGKTRGLRDCRAPLPYMEI